MKKKRSLKKKNAPLKTSRIKKKLSLNTELQQLKDYEHMINLDVGTYLVLIEEGSPQQIAFAKQRTRSALLKYGPDMYMLAQNIGGMFPNYVEDFLHSVDDLVHAAGWIDQALVNTCYYATQRLDEALKKSA